MYKFIQCGLFVFDKLSAQIITYFLLILHPHFLPHFILKMEILQTLFSSSYFALFVIITFSYLLGRIKIKGISLDVSAVIFVALLFGHFGVSLPKDIQNIGLVLFIFTIGIQAGPGFFDSLKKHGVKLAMLSTILIFSAGAITLGCAFVFDLNIPIVAGLLTGALTSTPGLASATDQFGELSSIGYGIAYPFGVIGVILFVKLLPKMMGSNIEDAEKDWERDSNKNHPEISYINIEITNENINNKTIQELHFSSITGGVISRVMRDAEAIVPNRDTALHVGDLVRIVGTKDAIENGLMLLGKSTEKKIPLSKDYDVRTILVTNKAVVNKTISQLGLQGFDATITRIRRAGIDIAPNSRSHIHFGDKLVMVASRETIKQASRLFGDNNKKLSDTDFLPIALGITIGVLLGKFTFLGLTGGVLIAALVLSKIGKTGNILWTMSGSANALLRELGLILFLAVVGTSAGATLVETFQEYGYKLFLVGALITLLPMIIMTIFARFVYKINILSVLGGLAGGMTSTPGLAAVSSMSESNAPQIAYATAYPIAMVLLVIVVKLLAFFA